MNFIEEAIKAGVNSALLTTMTAMPAIIESFDAESQTVDVSIAIMQIIDGKNEPYPLLVDVPILIPSVAGFHITMPIKKGDECLLVFSSRCIDSWFERGGVQPQQEHRVHHISDGFALIGINSLGNVIPSYSVTDLAIRNTDNTQSIVLKENADIEVVTTGKINVTCTQAVISASTVVIDSPLTALAGSLTYAGTISKAPPPPTS